jgi:hypothetical protein
MTPMELSFAQAMLPKQEIIKKHATSKNENFFLTAYASPPLSGIIDGKTPLLQ